MRQYVRAMLGLLVMLIAWPAAAQTARVTADRATVREKPATASSAVATVTVNTELDVLEVSGTWLRVRIRASGLEGFIPAAFVQQSAATPAPTAGNPPAPAQPAAPSAPPVGPGSYRTFLVRAFGGLWSSGGDTGVQAGGGVALAPFSNEALEIAIDGSFLRVSGINAYSGSGGATYNFVLPSQKFTPFAGAGLTFLHTPGQTVIVDLLDSSFPVSFGGGTDVALQLVGGVDRPLNDRRAFRAELRLQVLPGGTSMALLAGLSF